MKQQELSPIVNGNVKCTNILEDCLAVSYKTEHTLDIWTSNWATWYLPKWTKNYVHTKTCTWVFMAAHIRSKEVLHNAIFLYFVHNKHLQISNKYIDTNETYRWGKHSGWFWSSVRIETVKIAGVKFWFGQTGSHLWVSITSSEKWKHFYITVKCKQVNIWNDFA